MKANYVETDFQRAVEVVSDAAPPTALAERLGIEWDYLGWLAVGLAEEVLGNAAGEWKAVANGAEAFTAGFLIGAHLQPGAGRRRKGKLLPWAVEHVSTRGRHAVIADYCDLSAVALFERVYAAALVEAIDVPPEQRGALEQPVTTLFESGLATGLVLGDL